MPDKISDKKPWKDPLIKPPNNEKLTKLHKFESYNDPFTLNNMNMHQLADTRPESTKTKECPRETTELTSFESGSPLNVESKCDLTRISFPCFEVLQKLLCSFLYLHGGPAVQNATPKLQRWVSHPHIHRFIKQNKVNIQLSDGTQGKRREIEYWNW